MPLIPALYCGWVENRIIKKGPVNFSEYDIRVNCDDSAYDNVWKCNSKDYLSDYLNDATVKATFNATTTYKIFDFWTGILMSVWDINMNKAYYLRNVLHAGIPVIQFYGDKDYLCNWYGGVKQMNEFVWEH